MDPDTEGHPVLTGLVALVGVGLVVGLLVSGGALAATQVLGLRGGGSTTGGESRQSMYIPAPAPTETDSAPLVTLAPGEETPSETASSAPATEESQISLSAGETEVSPMQQIDLTGTYPEGEGHIVQVQRREGGTWVDFASVDAVVSNATFGTYVQTSRLGVNKFRVRDTDGDIVSNAVRVRIQ